MAQLIIVSNRLPVTVEKEDSSLRFKTSIGGLATGMSSILKTRDYIWLGWCGLTEEKLAPEEKTQLIESFVREYRCYPLFYSKKDLELYYNGFCNKTIWPLFHYFAVYAEHKKQTWLQYVKINEYFLNSLDHVIGTADYIWIHDYHLMLLPRLIREKYPEAKIGFFLHIPFPSYEIFRLLPWRDKVLDGILGADLIGFHTYDYARHFLSSVLHLAGIEHNLGQLIYKNRYVRVDTFPMGIDYEKYHQAPKVRTVKKADRQLLTKVQGAKVILSVDRLDYTKGIPQRIKAFAMFLAGHPEYREKVTLILIVAPSRVGVTKYLDLRREVEELVSHINGQLGTMDWIPIWYFYRSFNFEQLTPLYSRADVLLVTPLRDGMNLIAKEYLAAKSDNESGVLILSETAGAASELGEALLVNPNNLEEIAAAIKQALEMPLTEQLEKIEVMQRRLARYNIQYWAKDFIDKLDYVAALQEKNLLRQLTEKNKGTLLQDYKRSERRLFILNYEGTLVETIGGSKIPPPDRELLEVLRNLSDTPGNEVILMSETDKESLDKWFTDLKLNLLSAHGVWIKIKSDQWRKIENINNDWKQEIRPILEVYMDRTPGSFIVEKEYSLFWNYSRSEPELGLLRASELKGVLFGLTSNMSIGVIEGKKFLEITNTVINKASTLSSWLLKPDWQFILAIGHDYTSEDLFAVLPDGAYSIKIGFSISQAKYFLPSPYKVRSLLQELAQARG